MVQRLVRLLEFKLLNHALNPVVLRELDGFFRILCVAGWPCSDTVSVMNHERSVELDRSWWCGQNYELAERSEALQQGRNQISIWCSENDR